MSKSSSITIGYSIFSFIAALFSWWVNKSVGWAIIHFCLGILYVLFATCVHGDVLNAEVRRLVP